MRCHEGDVSEEGMIRVATLQEVTGSFGEKVGGVHTEPDVIDMALDDGVANKRIANEPKKMS
ncbi:MAG: hypothetical protein ACOCUY_00505 [Verrucomicrobiota bacterium]